MKIKIDLSQEPFHSCPQFEKCQVNDCPLASKPNQYKTMPGDKLIFGFRKCRATKLTRMKIGKAFNMKSLGLTLRELSAMKASMRMKQSSFLMREKNLETRENSVLQPNNTFSKDFIPQFSSSQSKMALNKFQECN